MTIMQALFTGGALTLTISATTTNYNVFTAAGSPTTPKSVIVNINSGVTVGATAGNTAFTLGQFPTGSNIVVNNNGSILAYGGAGGTGGAGSSGGDAINANYANQTVIINNQTGAVIRGGGGGGGRGGNGGTGGMGYYTYTQTLGGASGYSPTSCDVSCTNTYGGGAYCNNGTYACPLSKGAGYTCSGFGGPVCLRTATAYTSGGGGGAGGNGGRGQGYDGANASGSAGSGGAAGGTNAGAGGTGGTGGAGAVYGSAGSTGSTGNTGASGNYTGGSGGAAGSAGGASGRYLVKGANSVTLNNSGTVTGGLA